MQKKCFFFKQANILFWIYLSKAQKVICIWLGLFAQYGKKSEVKVVCIYLKCQKTICILGNMLEKEIYT